MNTLDTIVLTLITLLPAFVIGGLVALISIIIADTRSKK